MMSTLWIVRLRFKVGIPRALMEFGWTSHPL